MYGLMTALLFIEKCSRYIGGPLKNCEIELRNCQPKKFFA
jgi:hypothetical protein